MFDKSIKGRVAIVTGANRGIGRSITEALLDRGAAKVYAGARNTDALKDLVEKYGDRVVPVALDVTSDEQVDAAAVLATDVDLLVNNAGIAEAGDLEFGNPKWIEAGRRESDVNVFGTLRMTQAFAPVLAANGGGTVANIISIAGIVSFPMFLSYSASKAALHSLTQGTRIQLGAQGTTVIGVYPGPVDTDMAEGLPFDKESPAVVANSILDGIESGDEEIYPDQMAREFGSAYATNPKQLERRMALPADAA